MNISNSELRNKILALYPEIEKFDMELMTEFSEEKGSWIVTLMKNGETLFTHIESSDARECIEEEKCFYLENQLMGFMDAYCSSSHACSA